MRRFFYDFNLFNQDSQDGINGDGVPDFGAFYLYVRRLGDYSKAVCGLGLIAQAVGFFHIQKCGPTGGQLIEVF